MEHLEITKTRPKSDAYQKRRSRILMETGAGSLKTGGMTCVGATYQPSSRSRFADLRRIRGALSLQNLSTARTYFWRRRSPITRLITSTRFRMERGGSAAMSHAYGALRRDVRARLGLSRGLGVARLVTRFDAG